jgi:disulfide bond formation protein DsbB
MKNKSLFLGKYGLYLAWIVSIVATVGSLYLSEVLMYVPCKLCWYQRILMYPLVIILGIASFRHDRSIVRYALPISIFGGSISLYHYAEQKIPALQNDVICRGGVPCSIDYLNWLNGVVTIPFLALIAFILITLLMLYVRKASQSQATEIL